MKRIVSIITLTVVLCGIFLTGPVAAAETNKVELKAAIEIAKTAFSFDVSKHDFTSSYSESKYGKKLWYLNWNSSVVGGGSGLSVTVDAATGEIINMNLWENTAASSGRIPKHTREEARKAAEELIRKLHPDKLKDTVLMDEYLDNLYRPVYNNDIYSFYYMRRIDGIDFQDNGIQIQIDKNTLKVRSFNLDWDTVIPIPDSKKAMAPDAAKKLYEEKLGLELAYQLIYPNPTGDPKLILVYSQKNASNHIDAITGEIIKQPYYGPVYTSNEKYAMDGAGGMGGYVPTPQEQKVIDDSSKYISKEKAVEALKKYLALDNKYKMDSSSLYGGMNNENATWSFSWSYADKVKNTYSYLYGAVDAVTGEVKNFSISNENDYKPNTAPRYTKEQSREIAEEFLKEMQPAKFKSSEYREQYYDIYTDTKNASSYSFNYIRKENGISAPFNNMNVTVSAHTGKVTNFYMSWQNFEFPDAAGVISLQDAYGTLYAKHDLKLKYARIYNYDPHNESTTIRLIYMADNINGMLDAKSGQFVDYSGKPVREAAKVSFTDISGHSFEKDIQLLVELGILDSAESKFNPDSRILQKDFVKLLVKAIQPVYYPVPYAGNNSEYDSYYEYVIQQGILAKKDKNPEAAVTRMEASRMLVKALGAGFVADLESIFSIDLKDAGAIAAGDKGYAAIASALKLVDTSAGSFNPDQQLAKGETAGMLVAMLKVDKNPAAAEAPATDSLLPYRQ